MIIHFIAAVHAFAIQPSCLLKPYPTSASLSSAIRMNNPLRACLK